MPLNFTVTYDDLTNNIDDTTGDIAAEACIGPMYFIPTIQDGDRIPALTSLARPSGLAARAFSGYLDSDGRLKSERGGAVGVRLWANDPDWELDRFTYLVCADLTDALGRPVRWNQFPFDAPSTDRVVPLAFEIPKPGQKFSRGRPAIDIAGVEVTVDKRLVLLRADGVRLTTDDPVFDGDVDNTDLFGAAYAMTFGA